MRRIFALTSAAALSLFCAACGPEGQDDDAPLQDARSSVTGTHRVMMTVSAPGVPINPDPAPTNLTLTEDPNSPDRMNLEIMFWDCDLSATMSGGSTFTVNPGTCGHPLPEELRDETSGCYFMMEFTGGTGGKASADGKFGTTLEGSYVMDCVEESGPPVKFPLTISLVGI
ncbi:hypothetical protein JYK02_11050 [Corallococcus macrosporus]|uniref:Lipoprotein n=1 Tax=Corallococcus macrosporus TaxID=35 RepID=A0ABS3DAH8_9BACT|nr:hypothetical protein [Corallococcus macrosporus]MBN8228045.1 hypothetical protein [Corallococcus macrosporus]